MKTKEHYKEEMKKDKKIILWEVKSFPLSLAHNPQILESPSSFFLPWRLSGYENKDE